MPDDEWPDDELLVDERGLHLKSLIENRARHIRHLYDFGDNWEHDIRVEDLPAISRNRCTAHGLRCRKNACPPQDVAGCTIDSRRRRTGIGTVYLTVGEDDGGARCVSSFPKREI